MLKYVYSGFNSINLTYSITESYFHFRTCFFKKRGPGIESQVGMLHLLQIDVNTEITIHGGGGGGGGEWGVQLVHAFIKVLMEQRASGIIVTQ